MAVTSFSIESIGGVISEFGLYTNDSLAHSLSSGASTAVLTGYLVAAVIATVLLTRRRPARVGTQPLAPAHPTLSVMSVGGATLGLIGLIVGWWLLNTQRYAYATLELAWGSMAFLSLVAMFGADRHLRRRGGGSLQRWALVVLQAPPVIILISWTVALLS